MTLMVQDLTNPMLAQVPHCLLAAHVGTIMGVETNGMQFYPEASAVEAQVHSGLYQRRGGMVDLGTLSGVGFILFPWCRDGDRGDTVHADGGPCCLSTCAGVPDHG